MNHVEERCEISNKFAVFCKQSCDRGLVVQQPVSPTKSAAGVLVDKVPFSARFRRTRIKSQIPSGTLIPPLLCSSDSNSVTATPNGRRRLRISAAQFGRDILGHLEGFLHTTHRIENVVKVNPLDPKVPLSDLSPHDKASLIVQDPEEFRQLQKALRAKAYTNMGLKQELFTHLLDDHINVLRNEELERKRWEDAMTRRKELLKSSKQDRGFRKCSIDLIAPQPNSPTVQDKRAASMGLGLPYTPNRRVKRIVPRQDSSFSAPASSIACS